MADAGSAAGERPAAAGRRVVPSTTAGWWAVGLSVVGIAAWVVLPMITMTFRTSYPITDTWVMPVIGLVLIDAAAVFDGLCMWRWRDRSVFNIVASVLVIPAALLATVIVVGEGFAGV